MRDRSLSVTVSRFAHTELKTAAVGGIEWSICNENWDTVLDELGMQAAGLKREFFLSAIPVVDTIDVLVVEPSGAEVQFVMDNDYTYSRSRNSITFTDYIPDPFADVLINYEVLATAGQDDGGTGTGTGTSGSGS